MMKFDVTRTLELALEYAAEKNKIIAKNISQANVPKAKAKTLKPLDFKEKLIKTQGVNLNKTDERHISGKSHPPKFRVEVDKTQDEETPVGNNIVLANQLKFASDTSLEYQEYLRAYAKLMDIEEDALE